MLFLLTLEWVWTMLESCLKLKTAWKIGCGNPHCQFIFALPKAIADFLNLMNSSQNLRFTFDSGMNNTEKQIMVSKTP